jgi:hypothetical protein
VTLELDVLGQAIAPGHRLRLAVSSTYWPWLWPSPEPVELTLLAGAGSWVELPVRPLGADDGPAPRFGPPEAAAPLPLDVDEGTEAYQRIGRDVVSGTFTLELNQGGDRRVRLPDGLEMTDESRELFTIREGDPLSAAVESSRRLGLTRRDWNIAVRTKSRITGDLTDFRLVDTVEAFEGGERVFERTWDRSVPRDHV